MTSEIVNGIVLAAAFGALQQVAQHYFPWGLVFRGELPKVPAYIMGTLGWVIPLTILFWHWDLTVFMAPRWAHLVAVWACVGASGFAVIFVRGLDWVMDRVTRSFEHEERDEAQA
jgi:hypothetical protein